MTYQDRIADVDAQLRGIQTERRERREMGRLINRRGELERKALRQEQEQHAERIDPTWRDRLAAARVAEAEAQAAYDQFRDARLARAQGVVYVPGDTGRGRVKGAYDKTGGMTVVVATTSIGRQRSLTVLDEAPLFEKHLQDELTLAKNHRIRLERWPARLDLEAPAGETAEDRIAAAPRISFGSRTSWPLRAEASARIRARFAKGEGTDEAG